MEVFLRQQKRRSITASGEQLFLKDFRAEGEIKKRKNTRKECENDRYDNSSERVNGQMA
jgi:hypothetical protein